MVTTGDIVLALGVLNVAYLVYRFNTRISPGIPYAGSSTPARDSTLVERLQTSQEYGKDPVSVLCKTRSILGDVFCIDLILVKIIFFLGPEANKEVLKIAEDDLSFVDAIRWSLGPMVSHMFEFPGWHAPSAKLLRAALLREERIDAYHAMCTHITESTFREWAEKGTIPLFQSISHIVISGLIMLLAGEGVYSRHHKELTPMLDELERELQRPILRVLPWALWRFTNPGKHLFATCARFDEIITAEMRDILAHPEKHAGRDDFFYSLVMQRGPDFAPCYGRYIMSVIFGAHANVAMTIPWLFLHARRTPGAIERIREEAVLPRGEPKPYLEACMRETSRLYTNLSLLRIARKTMHIEGHLIPKGTFVAVSPLATQRADVADNGIFEDAGKWNPMRFLAEREGKEEGDVQALSPYTEWHRRGEFIHFGMSQHICPGEKLARMFIFDLILKAWMEKFEVEVVSGLQEGIKGIDGVGAEGAWTVENFGTPSIRGKDVMVTVKERP